MHSEWSGEHEAPLTAPSPWAGPEAVGGSPAAGPEAGGGFPAAGPESEMRPDTTTVQGGPATEPPTPVRSASAEVSEASESASGVGIGSDEDRSGAEDRFVPGSEELPVTEEELHRSQVDAVDTLLDEVELALARLDDGTYGRCEACGAPIDDRRLAGAPIVRSCGNCGEIDAVQPVGSIAG